MKSVLSDSNARLVAARGLTARRLRNETGRFLVEGVQGVREALLRPDVVIEVFASPEAADRHGDLVRSSRAPVSLVSPKAMAALSETVTPQGLVAVCRAVDIPLEAAVSRRPRLATLLVGANDPGNVGTILRTADAAGAGLLALAEDSVDVYNGKAVRATAGSLFHLDVVVGRSAADVMSACRSAGMAVLATSGTGECDLDRLIDDGSLAGPVLWVFGNEANGLSPEVMQLADRVVRIPVYGRAESLNLAAAAAVCLYASARADRRDPSSGAVKSLGRRS